MEFNTSPSYTFESPSCPERFYENLIDFGRLITELVSICHEKHVNVIHPTLLQIGIDYVAGMDKVKIIENFIESSKGVWDKIVNRDETFFSEKQNGEKLFVGLPNVVEHIYVLLTSRDEDGLPLITDEDKMAVWNYADSWLRICIRYIHDKRKPKLVPTADGRYERKYSVRYQADLKILPYAEHYGVDLDCDPVVAPQMLSQSSAQSSAQSPVSPSQSPVSPSQSPAVPSQSPATPSQSPVSPSQSPATPSQSPATPSQSPAVPLAIGLSPVPVSPSLI